MVSLVVIGGLLSNDAPKRLFPSIAIYSGTASILERYNVEIGLFIALFSIALSVLFYLYPRSPSVAMEATPTVSVAPPSQSDK